MSDEEICDLYAKLDAIPKYLRSSLRPNLPHTRRTLRGWRDVVRCLLGIHCVELSGRDAGMFIERCSCGAVRLNRHGGWFDAHPFTITDEDGYTRRQRCDQRRIAADRKGIDMSEPTKTLNCVHCGIQIVSTGDGYTHIPRTQDPLTDCADPRPADAKTTTKPVNLFRRTTPTPFSLLSCMFGHTYRVVLENGQPIALECTGCAATWKTERVEREQA